MEGPVFATLPNDYKEIRNSVMETRLASPGSSFSKACDVLARAVTSLPEVPHTRPKFTLLRKLGTVSSFGT